MELNFKSLIIKINLYRFDNSNAQGLMEFMSEEEKREFWFDVASIDWTDYISNVHIPGLRTHVMKGKRGIN